MLTICLNSPPNVSLSDHLDAIVRRPDNEGTIHAEDKILDALDHAFDLLGASR